MAKQYIQMKKILSFLFSTRLMAMLFVSFAVAMAVATFIENDFGTPTSRVIVYNTLWFEAIMFLFVINFLGNIFKFKLFRPKKIITLAFHLSFILIIIGAVITRYISYEGQSSIIEGQSTDYLLSQRTYLHLHVNNGEIERNLYKKVEFSNFKPNFFNNFNWKTDFKGEDISVKYVNFTENAEAVFAKDENGKKHLHLVETREGKRLEHYIKENSYLFINGVSIGFNSKENTAIKIFEKDNKFFLETDQDGSYYRMRDEFQGLVYKDSVQKLNLLSLYTLQGLQFVIPTLGVYGNENVISGDGIFNQLIVDVTSKGETKRVELRGRQYYMIEPEVFKIGDLHFALRYGSIAKDLGFTIKLNDFQLEKYPGSMSPKSYASEVTIIDRKDNKTFDFRIYMNNILDYKGFRFFQSSYNITDEYEETHLSVNHDFWGTWITYIGYGLLYLAMTLLLFTPGSRFTNLKKMLKKIETKKANLSIIFLLFTAISFSQHNHEAPDIDLLLKKEVVSLEHAEKFAKLIIQEENGRMEPVNTFASKLLRKVSKKDNFKGMNADQVTLSILLNPRLWYAVPIIYIERGNTQVRDVLGIDHSQKYATLIDFFDTSGKYKLMKEVEDAHKTQIKSKYQNDIIKIDKRLNLMYVAVDGALFRFFPKPNDPDNKWYSTKEAPSAGFKGMDSVVIADILLLYAMELDNAKKTNDYTQAELILDGISKFQKQYGAHIMPSEKQVEFEIMYNKYDIFKKLFSQYLYAGMILFILVLVQMFTKNKFIDIASKIFVGIIVFLFLLQTTALGIRWYIAGYAPWSNAYESMVYISWATMFFGLILGRKSKMTIASATFVASMMLMIAHWNWMDPSIGNLVPVLNSYWLMIHVSIIVASYGSFAVAMITGFVSLLLMIFTTKKNMPLMKLNIQELTIITEMALTLGLIMLTIGNFLGGQWANESWGRYWGWDPKETWTLISIMVYAFVIHARFVPGLRDKWTFNVLAVFSFTSILMTYLGVNHLLSGLHSYAAGEKASIPNQIWVSLAVAAIISAFAYFKYKKFYSSSDS